MPPDDVRIRQMVDAVETALRFVAGKARRDLDEDEMLVLALTKLVEIIGEAAKRVTPETRQQYPAVPWSTIESDLPGLLGTLPRPVEG